jgi:two-component system chemotaxis sensor kinase CheA
MSEPLDTFLDDYFAEADEHLAVIRAALLALEQSIGQPRPDGQTLEQLFRSFHSLKGLAGMVDHRDTEMLAHELESYLRALREGEASLSTATMDVMIKAAGALEASIAAHRTSSPAVDFTAIVAELRDLPAEADRGGAIVEGGQATNWTCVFTPSAQLVARGINVDVVRARLRQAGEILNATPIITNQGAVAFNFAVRGTITDAHVAAWQLDGMVVTPAAPASPEVKPADDGELRPGTAAGSGHHVRVDLARLDDLMRMIGNLVILRSRLHDTVERSERHLPAAQFRAMQDDTEAIEREIRELRDGVMRVRMVPVGEIFRRMPFVVRDLARETARSVTLRLSGQDTKIDKFLVERMMDPVLHLVRNAVSHGIERPDEREAAGKPATATLRLHASAAGETVTIEIADDGRGIDVEQVVARARQTGVSVPDGPLDTAVLLDILSAPGFSTRDTSDRVSGRGFGMNIVRQTVQELGGTIRLDTTPGTGTRFVIDLPLTLAITAAMIARVGEQVFAVPQAAVREVAEIDAAAVHSVPGGEMVEFRGAPLPVTRLSEVLGVPAGPAERFHAFIVGAGTSAVGLLVDRIVGHREIVVRSTADPLIRVTAVAGATDLGDGRAVLILDAGAIARQARERGARRGRSAVRDIA